MKNLTLKQAHALLDICPAPMLLVGADATVHGYNQAFGALLGETPGILNEPVYQQSLLLPLLGESYMVNWIMPDGDERWLAVDAANVDDAPGAVVRFFLDVTDRIRLRNERDALMDELKKQALRDELLTSLLSRHGVLISLEPLVARSRRYNTPLSIITMNIATGQDRNQALTRIAHLLNDQTRWADLVGCSSRHDFILVLQETSRDSALRLVEKLDSHLARMNETSDQPIVACYGVTDCQKNDNAESMLKRAEAALAEACRNQGGTAIAV
ncbi:MAG: diguanylate cyclase [Gammaproteobacteria bacterium]